MLIASTRILHEIITQHSVLIASTRIPDEIIIQLNDSIHCIPIRRGTIMSLSECMHSKIMIMALIILPSVSIVSCIIHDDIVIQLLVLMLCI